MERLLVVMVGRRVELARLRHLDVRGHEAYRGLHAHLVPRNQLHLYVWVFVLEMRCY